jgi:hypothetical protein
MHTILMLLLVATSSADGSYLPVLTCSSACCLPVQKVEAAPASLRVTDAKNMLELWRDVYDC